MAKKKNKIFVLDTNVILHDSTCIKNFEDNDIVIPISVLEELDQFKRGNEQIHFNARDFLRQLDDFSINSLNDNYDNKNGKIKVVVNHNWHPTVKEVFSEDCADNRIINCAYKIQNENPDRTIVIVSKDTNMRLKSRSLSLIAEDYTTDAVELFDNVYNPANFIKDARDSEIELIEKNGEVEIDQLNSIKHPSPNESFILRNGTKSILVTFDAFKNKIVQLNTQDAYGIVPRNAEQSFALNVLMNDRVQLVILTGKAGTGKTLLALASALEKRKTELRYYEISGINTRKVLDKYSMELLLRLESIVSTGSFMTYSLWASGPTLKGASTSWMLLTVPIVLMGIFRYQFLSDPSIRKKQIYQDLYVDSENPVNMFLNDKGMKIIVSSWIITVFFITAFN